MRMQVLATFVAICSVAQGVTATETAPLVGRELGSWTLADYRGKDWSASDFADREVLVIAFLGVECPLAKLYAPVLQRLADAYSGKNVSFIAVDANRHDALTEMAGFARQQNLQIPFVKDLNNVLADRLGATRTPELFVLDRARTVRYHGRIDDQHTVGGHSRSQPSRHDLKEAIDELLAGQSVSVATTELAGCLIGKVRPVSATADVTYAEQIAPLLQARCVECHREGEIGPFQLTSYEEAAGWAPMMAEVTRERRMPPWHADPEHGEFINSTRLTDEEVELFQKWSLAGAPSGDLKKAPPPREFTQGWQLSREPDLVVEMASKPFAVPAEGEVKYQYFSVDPKLTEDKWVSAAQIVPGNRSIVHHVIVFATVDGKISDDDGQMLTAYVPGMRVMPLPEGYAKKIAAGSRFIFQLHYTPNGTAQEDLTRIGLYFADPASVKYSVQTASTRSRGFEIVPYKADQSFVSNPSTAPIDLQLLSLSPHMHLRGQSFRYELQRPDGKPETLLDVPQYDFNWQTSYRLREPMTIPKGSRMTAYAKFDNSTGNVSNPDPSKTVTWGDQSWDEMLIGYFDIAVPRDLGDRSVATELRRQGIAVEMVERTLKTIDRNKNGQIEASEVKGIPRLEEAFSKIDEDGDGIATREELLKNLSKLRR